MIIDNFPDGEIPLGRLSEEARSWVDLNKMHEALGLDGQSSDESEDGLEGSTYAVHKLQWRSEEVLKRYRKVKISQVQANGKRRTGAAPRKRVRLQNQSESLRLAPTGKPINLYDKAWYDGLSTRQKRDLAATDALKFLTSADLE